MIPRRYCHIIPGRDDSSDSGHCLSSKFASRLSSPQVVIRASTAFRKKRPVTSIPTQQVDLLLVFTLAMAASGALGRR
jgi:hypothetical protein